MTGTSSIQQPLLKRIVFQMTIATVLICHGNLSLDAETVIVHVLNGKNGRPVTDEQINVFFPGTRRTQLLLATNSKGDVEFDADRANAFQVYPDFYEDCRKWLGNVSMSPSYSVSDVIASGVVAQNSCGKQSMEPKRGQLIYFVRPLRWWEKMKW